MSDQLYSVQTNLITSENRDDVNAFCRLVQLRTKGRLGKNGQKRFCRLQTRLMRQGVIKPIPDETLKKAARVMYDGLPWWRKLWLQLTFFKEHFEEKRRSRRLRLNR